MAPISYEMKRKINRLQSYIQQADALEQAQRLDEAQAAYNACLQMAAHEHIPLMVGQLVQIWMGIGFCHADRNDWHDALEWYHRAEALLLSMPPFTPDSNSPEARTNARKWSRYLPEGVTVWLPQDYPAEAHLAALWVSVAMAYEHANQLERAQAYYRRSADLYSKLDLPEYEAKVCWRQAAGYQSRQLWFDLEQTAGRMLLAAERGQSRPLMLAAQRLLAQSQINQNRPFKTLEHLCEVVALARELRDANLAFEEDILRKLIQDIRPGVLKLGQADFLAPLVHAEALINDPNLVQDRALLEKWEHEQPSTLLPGSIPVGTLHSLSEAAMVLEHFALRHCGVSSPTEHSSQKDLAEVSRRDETGKQRLWAITEEEMPVFNKDAQGQLVQTTNTFAVLTFFGQPEVIISVALAASECTVMVMEERNLPGFSQTCFFSVARESIPSQAEALLSCLGSFIQRGLFVKTEKGLKYAGPRQP